MQRLHERYLRKTPQQTRSRHLVDSILTAGLESLRTGTGDGADLPITMDALARSAGIGIGSLYDYFEDRSRLAAAVVAMLLERGIGRWDRVMAEIPSLPLARAIVAIVDAAVSMFGEEPALARRIARVASRSELVPLLDEVAESCAASLGRALRRRPDVETVDLDHAVAGFSVAALANLRARAWSNEELPELREKLVSMLVRRLGVQAPTEQALVA